MSLGPPVLHFLQVGCIFLLTLFALSFYTLPVTDVPPQASCKKKGARTVAVRTVCTTHARQAAPAVRRPPTSLCNARHGGPSRLQTTLCSPSPVVAACLRGGPDAPLRCGGQRPAFAGGAAFSGGRSCFSLPRPGGLAGPAGLWKQPCRPAAGGCAGAAEPQLPNGCEAANAYLGAQGSPLRAASLSGAGTDKLLAELLAGQPGCNAGLTQAAPLPLRSQREAVSCVPPMRRAILSARRTFLSRSVPFETFAFCFSFYS